MTCCQPCDPNSDFPDLRKPSLNKIISAAILIDEDERILIARRPDTKDFAGYWEFPGGKVEKDEAPEVAVVRELKEELDITTCPSCLSPLNFISYRYENFHLLMFMYICRKWEGFTKGMEGQELKWVTKDQLSNYKMPEANKEIIAYIIKHC